MKVLTLTAMLLAGISSAAIAAETGAGSAPPAAGAAGAVTPNQREAIKAGINEAIAADPSIAPLGTNNAGVPITSTNPAVGNTPTATNTPGVNNIPGGMNQDGTVAGAPVRTPPVTTGSNPQNAPTPSMRAPTPVPHSAGNGTSGR